MKWKRWKFGFFYSDRK